MMMMMSIAGQERSVRAMNGHSQAAQTPLATITRPSHKFVRFREKLTYPVCRNDGDF